ncbi:hypothetical protein [Pontibacter burrus]|uniref:O-antigen ligase domain-containing protein n=1 Tax=Pontibacter burrus TaxID=2704466 RepID=A0A6B3LLS9_9BACT|nr:hypothetical protein [Pontibacter burrus]NEM97749.1 hypothetical protein [Pontibacter burrus]
MIGFGIMLLAVYLYWESSKRYLSVFLVFFIVTGGFQLVPTDLMVLSTIGITKTYDWALVYLILLLVVEPRIILNLTIWKDRNGIALYSGVLLFLLLYNLLFVGVEVQVAIRVFRNYIFFLLLFPFVNLPTPDFIKVFRLLTYFTTLASFLFCLQPLLGHGILAGAPELLPDEGGGLIRFYNLPYFLVPVTLALLVGKSSLNLRYHYLVLTINLVAIVLSQHRNLILSIPICYFTFLIIQNKLNLIKVTASSVAIVVAFFCINYFFEGRFFKGIVKLSESFNEVTPTIIQYANLSDISTTEFRRLHFMERLYYVQADVLKSLFGIGFLTEDSALTKQLSFNIGLLTEYGDIIQVDTSDITWSLLLVHFGLVGIAAFLYFYWSCLRICYSNKDQALFMLGVLYITNLLFISFFGIDIVSVHTITLLAFILGFYYSLKSHINQKSQPETQIQQYAS